MCFQASVVDVIYEGIARAAGVVEIYGGAAPQEEQRQLLQQMVLRIMNVGQRPSYPSNPVLEQEPRRCRF